MLSGSIITNLSQTNDALTAHLSHTYHALNFVQSYEKFLDFARKIGVFLCKEYYYIYYVYIVQFVGENVGKMRQKCKICTVEKYA